MKKLFSILLCYCSLCQAQEYADYKLSDYKLPDIKRSSLDFKLNSDGSFATHETSDNTVYPALAKGPLSLPPMGLSHGR